MDKIRINKIRIEKIKINNIRVFKLKKRKIKQQPGGAGESRRLNGRLQKPSNVKEY